MPVEIIIAPEDIKYAESILLPNGYTFDDEHGQRVTFIQDLGTCDLQAVPGSGKTTALLAKLLILEKHLPFLDGSGILVLSHTNNAVEEIKSKIHKHCPRLFSYPNFVGTIQGFVDEFLAIPCALNKLNCRITSIDSDRYEKEIWKEYSFVEWSEKYDKISILFWRRHIDRAKKESAKQRVTEKELCNDLIKKEVKSVWYDYIQNVFRSGDKDKILLKADTNKRFIGLKFVTDNIIEKGIISYKYAYHLGMFYISQYPKVKNIIQERFKYVFVDEMQDMDTHQYDLLEEIFFDKGKSASIFQRIGDKNQAIFSNGPKLEEVWSVRDRLLKIEGSIRLKPSIASIVESFSLDKNFNLFGLKKEDGVKPCMIVYKEGEEAKVLQKYAEIIKSYQRIGLIPNYNSQKIGKEKEYQFHAIAWRKEHEDVVKICLKNYYPNFSQEGHNKYKIDFATLECYLVHYDKSIQNFEPIRKNIINALLWVLQEQGIKSKESKKSSNYTKTTLINYLSNNYKSFYEDFKLKMYRWCLDVIRGKRESVLCEIRNFIPEFLTCLDCESCLLNSNTIKFLNSRTAITAILSVPNVTQKPLNVFVPDGIENMEIKVGTVHSVKGQTHVATLYMESFNETGRGNYESERLIDQFNFETLQTTLSKITTCHEIVQKSAKMIYVGFSRPTHLLCFAVRKDRYDKMRVDTNLWQPEFI